ncbi:uncharacterized protein TNCV_4716611 [Trichonephila clavipes]|nr:uncharacterized protein TNCV_4716611 [Trichonephila clavipes]
MDESSDSDLYKVGAGIYLIHPNGELESYRIPTCKIFSNFACELMAITETLDNYHRRAIESFSGILLFSDSRSALQTILRGTSQLTQYIIDLRNRVFAVQRTCTLQWILAHIDTSAISSLIKLPRRPKIPFNFSTALPLPMRMQ